MLLWLKAARRSFRKPCAAMAADTPRRLNLPPLGFLRASALASLCLEDIVNSKLDHKVARESVGALDDDSPRPLDFVL
jgi:hypothetical protein